MSVPLIHAVREDYTGYHQQTPATAAAIPPESVEIDEPVPSGLDRRLGYFGQARFVLFYYEPRGDEVIWKDSWSYGFGTGAWGYFFDHIAPLAGRHGVNLGNSEMSGSQVLLIDRLEGLMYFAERRCAERFLAQQRGLDGSRATGG